MNLGLSALSRAFCRYLLYAVLAITAFSCVSRKRIAYFRDLKDTTVHKIPEHPYVEPVIQVDDILSVTIQTIDPQTSSIINQITSPIPSVGTSSASSIGNQVVHGFLVDKEGFIELPMIGKVKIGGLSTFKARDVIKEKAALYYKNPTVQVRFANYKITVIGEVTRPATYTLPNEKVSILDALGMAGDLTIYGRRENVLLIREVNGAKEFARFNLNSSDVFRSPYFYLKQNDIIYVEPNKNKAISASAYVNRNIAIIGSAISLIILLLIRIK